MPLIIGLIFVIFLLPKILSDFWAANGDAIGSFFRAALYIGIAIFIVVALYHFIAEQVRHRKEEAKRLAAQRAADLAQAKAVADGIRRQKEEDELRRVRDARKREEDRIEAERQAAEHQLSLERNIRYVIDEANEIIRILPIRLNRAEMAINAAVVDFRETVYNHFWENMERAIEALNDYDFKLARLKQLSNAYAGLSTESKKPSPAFPISARLAAATKIAAESAIRLKLLDRAAQSDADFGIIFNQRKQISVLIKGFQRLSDKLGSIERTIVDTGQALEERIVELNESVQDSAHDTRRAIGRVGDAVLFLGDSVWESSARISDAISDLSGSMSEQAQSVKIDGASIRDINQRSLEIQTKSLEYLDNIQRGREPLPTLEAHLRLAARTRPAKR